MSLYVQYGCGLSAPSGWKNFDASPTLRLQKLPALGNIFQKKVAFPPNVLFGDILTGLPGIPLSACDGVYCSHVLEHLALTDLRTALANTYKILKPGGIFRCVVPDLQAAVKSYNRRKESGECDAAHKFLQETMLGITTRPKGIKQLLISFFGNSHHLWMWDSESLTKELEQVGFCKVRSCSFNDSEDAAFKEVEDIGRFHDAVALEAFKPE